MASLVVRNLDEAVKERLRIRAARHGRSMEAEARAILTAATAPTPAARPFVQRTSSMGRPSISLDDVAAALDEAEGESRL